MYRFIRLSIVLFCAISFSATAQEFKGKKLSTAINSNADELKPLLSEDGQTLYFVRANHTENIGGKKGGQDIWMSQKDENGNWQKAVNLGAPLNNKAHNIMGGLGHQDTTQYFFLGNVYNEKWKTVSPGITMARKTTTGWMHPHQIFDEGQLPLAGHLTFHVSHDLQVMIISMHKHKDKKEDLYVAFRNGEEHWSNPISLGNDVNTKGHDIAPFLSQDKTTLFFASDGLDGEGSMDIFMTKRLDESWQKWSAPINLGKEVNSNGFEAYFAINEKDRTAYFISGSSHKTLGDIYEVSLDDIALLKKEEKETPVKEDALAKSEKEELTVETLKTEEVKQEVISATLNELPKDFNHIHFDFDAIEFGDGECKKVDEVIAYLKKNPDMKITLAGHADDIGNKKVNDFISKARCKSVKAYMLRQGITEERISIVSFGHSKPIASNNSKDGRRQNRRVEFAMISN